MTCHLFRPTNLIFCHNFFDPGCPHWTVAVVIPAVLIVVTIVFFSFLISTFPIHSQSVFLRHLTAGFPFQTPCGHLGRYLSSFNFFLSVFFRRMFLHLKPSASTAPPLSLVTTNNTVTTIWPNLVVSCFPDLDAIDCLIRFSQRFSTSSYEKVQPPPYLKLLFFAFVLH